MDPLGWLFGLEHFGIKFGLHNITALLSALGHPETTFRAVHVAGTNGKGSVTAMVAASLTAAGYRTGRYTSPHLVDITERFAVDGTPVSREALASALADIRSAVERLQAQGGLSAHPTFFEVATAAAFELFRRSAVEIAVSEVGLGGRLDATNVLAPEVTAITTVGLDHEQYLGPSLESVAREKGGIIKPGVPVVTGRLPPAAAGAIERIARERDAPLIRALDEVRITDAHTPADALSGFGRTSSQSPVAIRSISRDYGSVRLGLAGHHQRDNAAVAVGVLEALDARGIPVSAAAVRSGLSGVRWPGRLEWRRTGGGRELLLDAAHNPEGAAALAAFLTASHAKLPLVFAVMRDKDAGGMLRALAPAAAAIVCTRASSPRSAEPAAIAALARSIAPQIPVAIAETPAAALERAWALSARIVVAGSMFLLGDVISSLE